MLIGHSTSAGELVPGVAAACNLVKAFNTIAAPYMTDGSLGTENLEMFLDCGGITPYAKKQLTTILTAWKWVTHI